MYVYLCVCDPPPTASFHIGAKKPTTGAMRKPHCPFCKGSHSPSLCDAVKEPKQRCDIVRQENSVSIVWGTTRYPPATPSTGVTTVDGSITQACVPMDSNRVITLLNNLAIHLLSILLLLKQQQCLLISNHTLHHITMCAY